MIISFSGVDCAGKSTQIEYLQNYLLAQGKRCTVLWYRPGYSKEFQKLKAWLRLGLSRLRNNKAPKPSRSAKPSPDNAPALKVPAPLWLCAALLDTLWQWAIKLRYLERRYDVVLCDRYLEDALLDLYFKYPQYAFGERWLQELKALFPKADLAIFLHLPYELILERQAQKREPFPDAEETRKQRYWAYQKMSLPKTALSLDASLPREALHQSIIAALQDLLQKRPPAAD